MAIRARSQHVQRDHQAPESPEILVQRVERLVGALTRHSRRIVERSPDEPCLEDHVHDIPLPVWRTIIDDWCRSDLVRREYGSEVAEGLRLAMTSFDDDQFRGFLLRLV